MNEKTARQIAEMKNQTIGVEVEMNWSDTLKPHTQGDIIKHRKGVADGTEIRRGI